MAAGRMAHTHDATGVAAVSGDIGAHIGVGSFDIVGLHGDIGLRQQTVIDRDEDEAVGKQEARLGADLAAFAEPPGAAMDEEDHRCVIRVRCVDVELGRTVVNGLRCWLARTPGG